MAESIFHLFPNLPLEIKLQIWYYTLPEGLNLEGLESTEPVFFFWKPGCWRPRLAPNPNEADDGDIVDKNVIFEFRYQYLENTFELPLAFLSRETQMLHQEWTRRRGIVMVRRQTQNETALFCRPLRPKDDVLYIRLNQWDEFLNECLDRSVCRFPGLSGLRLHLDSLMTRIAVPEAVLQRDDAGLRNLFTTFKSLESILIVVDEQPSQQDAAGALDMARHPWKFQNAPGDGVFYWNYDHSNFHFGGRRWSGPYEALYKLIDEDSAGLGEELTARGIRNFEVRLVVAIRT